MASRAIWRGHLRLALVSCPVALYSARHGQGGLHFHLINPETGNRIKMVTQDAETGKPLERSNLAKGYEISKNRHIILSDEDFESVRVDSSSTMTVDKFVEAADIDPMYYDSAYYLAPDGEAGEDVYAVLREAISQAGKVALSRVVIAQRERTIALRPYGVGLMAHTLYEQRDINSAKDVLGDVASREVAPELIDLATQLVEQQSGKFEPADLEDRYEARMREMIDAKVAGGHLVEQQEEEPVASDNVVDLVAALRKSLAAAESSKPAASSATKNRTKAAAKPTADAARPAQKPPRKRAS